MKKILWWVRRRSHLPMIIIATVVVLVLFFNEDTSVELNVQYQKQINELKREIDRNLDSAEYYKSRRLAIEHGEADLEHIAREQYHMQRPSEDVFLIKE
ncbi:MAG: hypothetical protein K2H86_08110 [Muribaculaceae bacterium]|nr:hypothetical protein [Muribaculaceae bacterium]